LFALLFADLLSESPETEISILELVPTDMSVFHLLVKPKVDKLDCGIKNLAFEAAVTKPPGKLKFQSPLL
jgi:hypothetical protein